MSLFKRRIGNEVSVQLDLPNGRMVQYRGWLKECRGSWILLEVIEQRELSKPAPWSEWKEREEVADGEPDFEDRSSIGSPWINTASPWLTSFIDVTETAPRYTVEAEQKKARRKLEEDVEAGRLPAKVLRHHPPSKLSLSMKAIRDARNSRNRK